MAFDNDKLNDVLVTLARLETQMNRLVSDAESEKEFRKQHNRDADVRVTKVEDRVRAIEDWKNEIHGRIVVTVSIAGIIVTAAVTIIIKYL